MCSTIICHPYNPPGRHGFQGYRLCLSLCLQSGSFACEKNELSLHRVKLPHLPCVFLIRAAILFCVRHEVNHCYHGVISILYRVVDQIQFLVQQSHLAFRQFDFLIRPSAGFRDHAVEACERREGRKLCRAVSACSCADGLPPCGAGASGYRRKGSSVRASFVTCLMAADLAVSCDGRAALHQVHALEHGIFSKFILNGEGDVSAACAAFSSASCRAFFSCSSAS